MMAAVSEGAPTHGAIAHLLPPTYKQMITSWLDEDTPSFDYGGFVVGEDEAEARLLGKSEGIVAGVPFFDEVFKQLDCAVEWHTQEGHPVKPITHCATVRGPIRKILLGERVALNTLSRCSGIATKTNATLSLLRSAGYNNVLAGTRKTTPGFRLVEKYGMLVGGADPHRHDLSAMVMLKDNHIWSCSKAKTLSHPTSNGTSHGLEKAAGTGDAIARAVSSARAAAGFSMKVEVECQSEQEADAAILAGADVVMLDNFRPDGLKTTATNLKRRLHTAHAGDEDVFHRYPNAEQSSLKRRDFLIEVSGGLTSANVRDYVCDAVDVVSTSSIHQGVRHVDFSLKVVVP